MQIYLDSQESNLSAASQVCLLSGNADGNGAECLSECQYTLGVASKMQSPGPDKSCLGNLQHSKDT